MPTIQFVAADGRITSLNAERGGSLMQAALTQGLPGINADCGGACQCATCHVWVDPAWVDRLPAIADQEDAMLDSTAAERRPNSRLSCCVVMDDSLDGIVVHLPDRQ